jgi:phosphate starvation-inducible PhoH-like protein
MPRKKPYQVNGEQKGQLDDSMTPPGLPVIRNPLKSQIKLKQFPWTDKQKEFFKVALNPSTRIVFVDGPAGTSKTLLATYCGLQLLNMHAVSDICYLRSAVESSDSHLGFLPGSADDKLRFYNLPFIDKLDELLTGTKASKLEETGRVSMFPINFARGLHWPDKVIIMDEAQNSTEQEIVTVLTRMGKNCRCFVLADPMQTDLRRSTGGFQKMFNIFSDEDSKDMGIHTFEFTEDDIMRSELVKYVVKKLKNVNNE